MEGLFISKSVESSWLRMLYACQGPFKPLQNAILQDLLNT